MGRADNDAPTRFLATFTRRSSPDRRPKKIVMISQISQIVAAASSKHITDLWLHHLLNDKCAIVITNIAICPQPFEFCENVLDVIKTNSVLYKVYNILQKKHVLSKKNKFDINLLNVMQIY